MSPGRLFQRMIALTVKRILSYTEMKPLLAFGKAKYISDRRVRIGKQW